MGCSSSVPVDNNKFMIMYCTLIPIKEKNNFYKIELIAQEEAVKVSERKFFDQVAQNEDKLILDFVQRKNFNKTTIFYFFEKNTPEIKNLYQMLNLIPNNYSQLHRIILLNTELVKDFYNCLIEKKTINLEYFKFVGKILDFNDMQNILENINNINLTNDNINYEENEEENKVNNDEINIEGLITEEKINQIKNNFSPKIKKISISELTIKNKNNFVQLIQFFLEKEIKIFSIYDTNINDIVIFNSLLDFFERNYHMRSITLHNCNLLDIHMNDLIRALSDKRLRYLDLSKNAITVVGATLISEFLLVNKTLKELNISYNDNANLKAEGIKYILRSLVDCPNIKLINFSGMILTGCGEFIGNFIAGNKSIEIIILKDIYLNCNDFKSIFEKVKLNTTLKTIDISNNDMGGDKALEYVGECIGTNNFLEILIMDKININNDNYSTIFEGIEKNKKIYYYSINYNKINPKIVFEFFMKQTQVKKLEFIPFDKNNPEDKNKDFSLDDKKLIEKCKVERPDLELIVI